MKRSINFNRGKRQRLTVRGLVDTMRFVGMVDDYGHLYGEHDCCAGCGVVRHLGYTVTCEEAQAAAREAAETHARSGEK